MTSKILKSILSVAVAVLLATLLVITGVLYQYFGGVQQSQLKDELSLAASATEQLGEKYLETLSSDRYRLTWVAPDGTVLFDTRADAADMENHAYIEVSVVSATCETDGKIERHCEYCGKDTTEQVKAMGHSWDVIATEATCTTPGVCTYVCTVCNNTRTEEINALGHTWDSGNTTTEATCTNAGVLTYTCTVCNDTKTEEVNAFGHDWGNATCESPSICNRCGDTKDSALGHTTDCGVCSRCNKEIRKQSPVTILDWTYNIDYVGGVEWNFKIRNNTDKQIKYVTMQWSCYNAVGDLIYCQIDRKSYKRVRFTGPLDAYTISESKRTTDKFYNYNLKSYKMNEIIVEYMDGTTETITNYHDNILG